MGFADVEKKTRPDADTIYSMASNVKSITALAALALRDDGVISLDDPITSLLPEASGLVYPTRDAPPITLRQLLTHTSGLPRIGNFENAMFDHPATEEEITRSLSGYPLATPPGTAYSYSNLGYGLLGLAVGRASHGSLRAFVKRRILDPLEMTATTYDVEAVPAGRLAPGYQSSATGAFEPIKGPQLGAFVGGGGLYSSLRDMARYLAFQLGAYPPRGEPDTGPIRRSSVRETHFNALEGDGLSADRYGYGWAIEESCDFDRLVWHSGGTQGYGSWWGFVPSSGVGVIVSTNRMAGRGLGRKALLAIKKSGGLPSRVPRMKTLSPALLAVMPRFLAVLNTWSEASFQAMLTRPNMNSIDDDRDELAGYRAVHGACKGFAPIEISSPWKARFSMACERGALEMEVEVSTGDGLLRGFTGISRDVSPPPELAGAAERVAGLIGKWDERVYKKLLAPGAPGSRADAELSFVQRRAAHGACKVTSFSRWANRPDFHLACERGGDLTLTLALDEKRKSVVKSYAITGEGSRACPAR